MKKLVYNIFDLLQINRLCVSSNKDRAMILCYHGVSDDDFDVLKGHEDRHVTETLFRKQMQYLIKHGYRFITLTGLVEKIKNNESVGKYVTLTFDDGFKNVIDNAYPIMKELGIKGCVYVISSLPGTGELLWTDMVESVIRNRKKGEFQFDFRGQSIVYKLDQKPSYHNAMLDIKKKLKSLTDQELKEHLKQFKNQPVGDVSKEFYLADWDQLKTLDSEVLEVGCHTHTHPNCANFTSRHQFEEEILKSKEEIERHMGYPIQHFCYPGGTFNEETMQYLKEFGFLSGTGIEPAYVSGKAEPLAFRRIFIGEDYPFYKAKVSGSYYVFSKLVGKLKGKDYQYQ